MIKTRFTPALMARRDDVCTGRALPALPAGTVENRIELTGELVAREKMPPMGTGNGKAGKAKPAPKPRGSGLRACPFCRELFTDDETDTCPECGLTVRDLAELPPSPDAEQLIHEEGHARAAGPAIPQTEMMPWKDMSRGRGPLLLLSVAGIATFFFLPWARQTVPETNIFSAIDLTHRTPFFWSALAAWLVLFPSVLTRRTILKMVGARVAVVALSAVPAMLAITMLRAPTQFVVKGLHFAIEWSAGLYVTLALSVLSTIFALRFGGKLDDVTVAKGSRSEKAEKAEKSETVH